MKVQQHTYVTAIYFTWHFHYANTIIYLIFCASS